MCHVSDSHLRKQPGTDLEGRQHCLYPNGGSEVSRSICCDATVAGWHAPRALPGNSQLIIVYEFYNSGCAPSVARTVAVCCIALHHHHHHRRRRRCRHHARSQRTLDSVVRRSLLLCGKDAGILFDIHVKGLRGQL